MDKVFSPVIIILAFAGISTISFATVSWPIIGIVLFAHLIWEIKK